MVIFEESVNRTGRKKAMREVDLILVLLYRSCGTWYRSRTGPGGLAVRRVNRSARFRTRREPDQNPLLSLRILKREDQC